MDYSIFYTHVIEPHQPISDGTYDVFISGYNKSARVREVFGRVCAREKIWIIHREYALAVADLPSYGARYARQTCDESEFWEGLVPQLIACSEGSRLCIDITGILVPYMMFLVALLSRLGVKKFDCLYSEPVSYVHREGTVFSGGYIREVRPVAGFSGEIDQDTSGDFLIIGAGYEDHLISEVAQHKDSAYKALVFGLPSLRVDMYQQNVLRANLADESLGRVPRRRRFFAPANDPFVTASVLQEIVGERTGVVPITNLYLSPLSSRAQALGFVIFYLYHKQCVDCMSMILPFCTKYEALTDVGVSRTWRYEVEL